VRHLLVQGGNNQIIEEEIEIEGIFDRNSKVEIAAAVIEVVVIVVWKETRSSEENRSGTLKGAVQVVSGETATGTTMEIKV
jgi:hypothetical protein